MSKVSNHLQLEVARTIQASPSEVYDAWLDPKVPGNPWHQADKLLLNPVIDGFFYWLTRGTAVYGRFTRLERGVCVQHTWVSPYTLGYESTVTVTFEKKGEDTLMTLVHANLPDDERARSHEKGWEYFLGSFSAQLAAKR